MKEILKRMIAIALVVITAGAFTMGLPETASAASKCSKPKVVKYINDKSNEITVYYSGGGKKANTLFVYMKAPGGSYKTVAATATSKGKQKSTVVKNLKPSTEYSFKVRAANKYNKKQYYNSKTKKWQNKKPKKKNWKGKKTRKVAAYRWYSSYSSEKTIRTAGQAEAVVESSDVIKTFNVAMNYSSADLSWNKVNGAEEYIIYVDGTQVKTTSGLSCRVTGLAPLSNYNIGIRPVAEGVEGDLVEVQKKTANIPAPAIKSQSSTDTSITISWNPVEGAERYKVYDPAESRYVLIDSSKTSYTFTGLEASTVYEITLSAGMPNKNGVRVYSNATSVSISTKGIPIAAPSKITAAATPIEVDLSWTPVSEATGYKVYDSAKKEIGTTTSYCCTVFNLSENTTYTFYVVAGKDGKYGDITNANKVSVRTPKKSEAREFPVRPEIKLSYGSAAFYIGQNWTTSLFNTLKSSSDGYEVLTRKNDIRSEISGRVYDVTVYLFDVDDYSNYLSVNVANGQILSWQTNGPLFGTVNDEDLVWGDCVNKYANSCRTGYRTGGGACTNIFTDIDVGDTVVGGFDGPQFYENHTTIETEKRIGYHMINAYRARAGLSILSYSDELDGKDYTWSGVANGKEYTDVRYGVQPFVETAWASSTVGHNTANMSQGPLAGISMTDRDAIIYKATGIVVRSEIVATGGAGGACLAAYMSSNMHLLAIVDPRATMVGIGFYGQYNGCVFAY